MDDLLKDSWTPKGSISSKIRERIKKAGKRFHANDNISEYIEDGEMEKERKINAIGELRCASPSEYP